MIDPAAPPPATYLDGVERELEALFAEARDVRSGSDSLQMAAGSWPVLYHVSPLRPVVLECLGLPGTARSVLELGAGCGAITRWLGERFDRVTAVEGSAARAALVRRRCRDLPGVDVFAANLFDVDAAEEYDVATLIGVLEYSALFHPRGRVDRREAAIEALRIAKSALRDPGLLVIAIENRLGAGYLLGRPEDHTGVPFEGVHGYPRDGTAVTYGARELLELVREAGFTNTQLLVPLPDYKFPRSVINLDELRPGDEVQNWVLGMDRAGRTGAATGSLIRHEVARAGLVGELADSFLLIASKGARESVAAQLGLDLVWTARHFALDRREIYRKTTTFRRNEIGALRAEVSQPGRQALSEQRATAEALTGLAHRVSDEPFRRGELVVTEVLRALTVGVSTDALRPHVLRYREWLIAEHGVQGAGFPMVDGGTIDAVWWNLVRDPATGAWGAIDLEWRLPQPVPADFVVWRMLRHLAARHPNHKPLGSATPAALAATTWLVAALPEAPLRLIPRFGELDDAIATTIASVPVPGNPRRALERLTAEAAADGSGARAREAAVRAVAEGVGAADRARVLAVRAAGAVVRRRRAGQAP